MRHIMNTQLLAGALVAALIAMGGLNATLATAGPNEPAPSAKSEPKTTPSNANISDASDSTAAPHASSRVEVRGFVHDANGGPVRGATIRLTSETDTVQVQSDGSGRFHVRLTASQGVRVLVRAYGYRDLVRIFGASHAVIQAALSLPPPYPLGWVTVTMASPDAQGSLEAAPAARLEEPLAI